MGEHDTDNDSSVGQGRGGQESVSGDPLSGQHGRHKLFVGMLHKSALDPIKTVLMLIGQYPAHHTPPHPTLPHPTLY